MRGASGTSVPALPRLGQITANTKTRRSRRTHEECQSDDHINEPALTSWPFFVSFVLFVFQS